MTHDAIILCDLRRTVVVVIVGVGDRCACAVFDLDLEAVALMSGVINRVEVVDAAIGDACLRGCGAQCHNGGCGTSKPGAKRSGGSETMENVFHKLSND